MDLREKNHKFSRKSHKYYRKKLLINKMCKKKNYEKKITNLKEKKS